MIPLRLLPSMLIALAVPLAAQPARAAGGPAGVALVAGPSEVDLSNACQRLRFTRQGGAFTLYTFVREGGGWRPLFDAGRPLVEGPSFNLRPTRYRVLLDRTDRKAVQFAGEHPDLHYPWTLDVDAAAGTPLFHFRLTCELPSPLPLSVPQPTVALWLTKPEPAFHLDQGPDSIYGSAGIPHGYGFPAAYLWDAGREAAIFFDMTPVRWVRPDGVWRFHDLRVMTRTRDGQAGLGLHLKKVSGKQLPAGRLIVEFTLYEGARAQRPGGLQALDTMVRTFAPCHPSQTVWPRAYPSGAAPTWREFAGKAMAELATVPGLHAEIPAAWHDAPLELVPSQPAMVVHPDRRRPTAEEAARNWDFSTVNNHLTPWLLLARLEGNAGALRLGMEKWNALPRFFDPRAGIIRSGTREPAHVGDLEMAWQNLYFHEETLRAASAAGPQEVNPAVLGRFLMSTAGLRALAAHVDYVLPQWFNPYTKQPACQNDVKALGYVREPWQVGTYAHLMMGAYRITGDNAFLSEAARAIETLMERTRYRVANDIYDRAYSDPADFPITELFGNAYGTLAARQVYRATGDRQFLGYSRDFMNTLLRLTFWYEDESDPVSRELRSAGLFYPHGGAHVATPWETSEAHLLIAQALGDDPEHPLTDLLLKLSNLNRVNSFYFFPAVWSKTVRDLEPSRDRTHGQYFPVEPFYCLEGDGGHRGETAAYMAGLALWNHWLYDALAEASDREIMVLNVAAVEGLEAALSGTERRFIAYNPAGTARDCRILFRHLPGAAYTVQVGRRSETCPAATLAHGLPLHLGPGQHVRIVVRDVRWRTRMRELAGRRSAGYALACAYRVLQESAASKGSGAVPPQSVADLQRACRLLRSGRCAEAAACARRLCE